MDCFISEILKSIKNSGEFGISIPELVSSVQSELNTTNLCANNLVRLSVDNLLGSGIVCYHGFRLVALS